MPKSIVFEGVRHTFPDDFTDSDIRSALSSTAPAAASADASGAERGSADWRAHLLAVLPAAGATVGGILGGSAGLAAGGIGAVPGAVIGGATGAAGGRVLENVGRQAMGIQPNQGLVERLLASGGHNVPGAVGQVMDTAEQALLGGVGEGIPAKLFGVPGKAAGMIEKGLSDFAKASEQKAVGRALEKVAKVDAARQMGPEVDAAAQAAMLARKRAGEAVSRHLSAHEVSGGKVTIKGIVDHIAENVQKQFGASPDKVKLFNQVRDRVQAVLHEHSLGAIKPKVAFTLGEANLAKRAFQYEQRAAYGSAAAGKASPKELDGAIASAFKEIVEQRAPGIEGLNRSAQTAIREHQDVLRMARAERSGIVRGLRRGQQERTAETLARLESQGAPFEPHISLHGVSVPGRSLGRAAGGAGRLLGKPAVAGTLRYSPDVANALLRLFMDQPMPADTTGGLQ